MGKKYSEVTADVADTRRPAIAGADRHPGWNALRRAAAGITTPLLPDDYLRLVNPLWSARELRGRVLAVHRETENAATLVIKPGWGFGFDYQPGQYVGIGLLVDGRWRWRSYSLTSPSSPASRPSARARTITITVKAMPEGFLSSHLVGGVAPGTIVRLAAPQGNFVLPDPAPGALLFITAGSGITPVMAMLRTLARRGLGAPPACGGFGDVVHLHSAPTAADVMFGAELADLARNHSGYRPVLRTTRSQGRLDLSRLDTDVPDWRDRQTWVCGPAAMLDAAERAWSAAGIGDRLHLERFAAVRTGLAGTAKGGGTVNFRRSGRSTVADAATSLMEAGERAGVQMPFGCRMGICRTCVVDLAEGHVRDLRTGAEHEPGARIQTCVSVAVGDCVLDI
ncbi:MAG TPA: ferredoxin reductase [Mycobacterium sp.]